MISMHPDRGFPGPLAPGIPLPEYLSGGLQLVGLVRGLVPGHSGPVAALGRGTGLGMTLADAVEALLCGPEVLMLEGQLAQTEFQLGQKVVDRKEAFDAVPLDTLRIEEELGRRPEGLEPFEGLGLSLYVSLDRNEIPGDGVNDVLIGVNLGLQPSTSRSHRGGAEIEQDRLLFGPGFRQSRVHIGQPLYGVHPTSSLEPDGVLPCYERFIDSAGIERPLAVPWVARCVPVTWGGAGKLHEKVVSGLLRRFSNREVAGSGLREQAGYNWKPIARGAPSQQHRGRL
jgi:hypothetical protein